MISLLKQEALMTKRNVAFEALSGNYLFQEIKKRIQKYEGTELISLGIGDTTQPLTPYVVKALVKASEEMGTLGGYHGYGLERGEKGLRHKISERIYKGRIDPQEIYISDGCKCDI
jgi:LL-diaminopimelate aminotransferase